MSSKWEGLMVEQVINNEQQTYTWPSRPVLHALCVPSQALGTCKQAKPPLAMSRAASGPTSAYMKHEPLLSSACRHWAQVDWDQAAIQALLYQMYHDLIETQTSCREG